MWRLFFFLLLYPVLIRGDWDHLFPGDENPEFFHHVNVITGHLRLHVTDTVVQGAVPIPLTRSYSSSTALERHFSDSTDLLFFKDGNVYGGWSLLASAILRIDSGKNGEGCSVVASDSSGNRTHFSFSHNDPNNKYVIFLKNADPFYPISGCLSGRNNPTNSTVRMDLKHGEAVLMLSNGGSRTYKGLPLKKFKGGTNHYFLSEEILPSKHKLTYKYGMNFRLEKISCTNLSGTKTFSWISFTSPAIKKFHVDADSSDGKSIKYDYVKYDHKQYLNSSQNPNGKNESTEFIRGRTGTGYRVGKVSWAGKDQFKAHYHLPPPEKEGIWAIFPNQIDWETDKVDFIEAPVGLKNEMLPIARFFYSFNYTDVRDVDDLLIRYEYESNHLKQIHYFDKNDKLYSSQKFYWKGSQLCCKAMLDSEHKPIFAKTFSFDAKGNVEKEVLWGNLTGIAGKLTVDEKGDPSGAETYTKKYSYYPESNLLSVEEQEEGPTIGYFYWADTDLLKTKNISDGSKILIRELYEYDNDNLLIKETVVDGPKDDSFSQKRIKRYVRDPISGLVKSATESYWDIEKQKEIPIKKIDYKYNRANQVETERVYNAKNILSYTLTTKYDDHGNIKSKTTPLGLENTYLYDECDQLIEIKEVGSSKKVFTYDAAGRQKTCEEPSLNRVTRYEYNAKGKIRSTTEFNENKIEQTYDSFGRCKETIFPLSKDEAGERYNPVAKFEYDIQGNLASITTPRDEKTQTFYNAIGKPIRIVQANGKEIRHIYNKNGTLAKTIYPDKTEVRYAYDIFQRKTAEEKFSPEGVVLLKETWEYTAFHLSSHTDPNGLKTTFTYDGAGRKIAEQAGDREILYSYDDLGFLEKITQAGNSKIEKHNLEGLIEETWEEDSLGNKENHTKYRFDSENRKQIAIRQTSKGEATDRFSYYEDGTLKAHTDPEGNVNQFEYNYFHKNDLNQNVLQKTSRDPSGNETIETYDANNKLVLCEKKSPDGATVFKEEFFYDRAGNRAKRESTVYAQDKLPKKVTTTWEYDQMGRVKKQIEGETKTTTYTYDDRGRLHQKTLPSSIIVTSIYDGADRLTSLTSSDASINYEYTNFIGHTPTQIIDHNRKTHVQRTYNPFGELTYETNTETELTTRWSYDTLGRRKTFTLPDQSSVHYDYEGLHLRTLTRHSPEGTPLYHHTYTSFDPNGHVAIEEPIFKLGIITTERDLLERPLSQTNPWLTHTLAYNKRGLVSEINNSLFGNKICTYDPLGQINQEGQQEHLFDSLGNSTDYETDACNQITSTLNGFTLSYDPNGNPTQWSSSDKKITLSYDPLGRLTEINDSTRKVCYLYDPLSRLIAKEVFLLWKDNWIKERKSLFLYDQDMEVGLLNEGKKLQEFKVLGLGLKGDIGAAVALELHNKLYAPLHDFSGTIIALITSDGKIAESYNFDAFGRETDPIKTINPWRFSSKRHDEGLIFFGLRFYDPSLKRWLTPDPAGFADGANLYTFVLNSPFNRLDLFGLASENFLIDLRIEIPIATFQGMTSITPVVCRGAIQGVPTDFIVACGYIHQLRYTPVEQLTGKINLAEHFAELMPSTGSCIGLCSVTKGINTSMEDFDAMCRSDIIKRAEGTLFISPYFPTQSLKKDYDQLKLDLKRVETSEATLTRQFMVGIAERLHKVNPNILWDLCSHSRGALLAIRSIEDMTDDQKELMKDHLCFTGIGGVEPMPRKFGLTVSNIYSTEDKAVAKYVEPFLDNPDYDITHVACRSGRSEWSMYYADHSFMGSTYQYARRERIKDLRRQYGYCTKSAR